MSLNVIKIVEKGRSILLPFEITASTVQSSISNEILYDGTVFESCKKEQTKNKIENTLKLSRLQGSIPKGAKLGFEPSYIPSLMSCVRLCFISLFYGGEKACIFYHVGTENRRMNGNKEVLNRLMSIL